MSSFAFSHSAPVIVFSHSVQPPFPLFGLTVVEDHLYLIPAMQFSVLFIACSTLYALKLLIQRRRQKVNEESPSQPLLQVRFLRPVGVIAALILVERIVYRHASSFALGVELTVVKVHRSFSFMGINGRLRCRLRSCYSHGGIRLL
jgi:hypothetical protein